jgi:uncharacterized protein (DUF305 family)
MRAQIVVVIGAVALAGTSASVRAQDEGSQAYMDAMSKMVRDTPMQPTGDADKDFVMMMIPHHQWAIDIAEVERKFGKDKKLRQIGEMIVKAQQKEMKQLEDWQDKHQ